MNEAPPPAFNVTVPRSARVWNYFLGGKDNFPADRAAGDHIFEAFPGIVEIARASRAFLTRAVRYLAGEAGIRQFLDIGTGLPTADNTHEVAQRVAPTCRVVYVDNDPLVLVHARALLVGTPEGATDYIEADVHEPEKILDGAAGTLDFTRPIALMMLGILGHVVDTGEAQAIVDRLMGALAPGSYLVVNDGGFDHGTANEEAHVEALRRRHESGIEPYCPRNPAQIAQFFHGLDLVEPGVVSTSLWRPDPDPARPPAAVDSFGAVGRKP